MPVLGVGEFLGHQRRFAELAKLAAKPIDNDLPVREKSILLKPKRELLAAPLGHFQKGEFDLAGLAANSIYEAKLLEPKQLLLQIAAYVIDNLDNIKREEDLRVQGDDREQIDPNRLTLFGLLKPGLSISRLRENLIEPSLGIPFVAHTIKENLICAAREGNGDIGALLGIITDPTLKPKEVEPLDLHRFHAHQGCCFTSD